MAEEIAWLSAVDLLARFRAGTLSPVDVTESLLGRIERVQPALNAFQFVDAEGAHMENVDRVFAGLTFTW